MQATDIVSLYDPEFSPLDIGTDPADTPADIVLDDDVSPGSLGFNILHGLFRRGPLLVNGVLQSINGKNGVLQSIKGKVLAFMNNPKNKSNLGATNGLLFKMLARDIQQTTVETILKRIELPLVDLIGESVLQDLIAGSSSTKPIMREELQKMLQKMLFSEKSSFAQSGMVVSSFIEKLISDKEIHTLKQLLKAKVHIIVAYAVDSVENKFLTDLIKKVRGKVGRLIALGKPVNAEALKDKGKIGKWNEKMPEDGYEVTVGNEEFRYADPMFEEDGSMIVPLCPSHVLDKRSGKPVKAHTIKAYAIEKDIATEVLVSKGSRHALPRRKFNDKVPQTKMLEPGEILISEIHFDPGPYNSNIDVVCVGPHGEELECIHFPATYLDAVRTYGRVQVEIQNVGAKAISLKDIHFKIRLYETDPHKREKCELRKTLQEAEKWEFSKNPRDTEKWIYNDLRHLIFTKVLSGKKGDNEFTRKQQLELGDMRNLENSFLGGIGLLFSVHENKGKKEDRCQLILSKSGEVQKLAYYSIERSGSRNTSGPDIAVSDQFKPKGYNSSQILLFPVLQNACSVGREKKTIFVCKNDIDPRELLRIIQEQAAQGKKITDIFTTPGDTALQPSSELKKICKENGIELTSIAVGEGEDPVYDLVGSKRKI